MVAFDISVAVGLYALLRPVHRPLALLAAAFGANLMNMASALGWATGGAGVSGMDSASSQALVLASMELHGLVYDLGLVFFGLACLVLGHLLRISRLVPAMLGVGLSLAGGVYLVGSFAVVLFPEIAPSLDPMYGFTLVAELAVAGCLLLKGVKAPATLGRHDATLVGGADLDTAEEIGGYDTVVLGGYTAACEKQQWFCRARSLRYRGYGVCPRRRRPVRRRLGAVRGLLVLGSSDCRGVARGGLLCVPARAHNSGGDRNASDRHGHRALRRHGLRTGRNWTQGRIDSADPKPGGQHPCRCGLGARLRARGLSWAVVYR